jgi:nucleotide-binding universal stress UspA family protein
MNILLAVDGSTYTKKALAFMVNYPGLAGEEHSLHILHVQMNIPPRVKSVVAREIIADYHQKEADKVLQPIIKFMNRHAIRFHADWVVGSPADEIVKVAKADKAHMIVMGTHGHNVLSRMLMGSVAQRVVTHCGMPVLLVQ